MSIEEEWVKCVAMSALLSRDNMASRDCGNADDSSSSSSMQSAAAAAAASSFARAVWSAGRNCSHLLPLFGTNHDCWLEERVSLVRMLKNCNRQTWWANCATKNSETARKVCNRTANLLYN